MKNITQSHMTNKQLSNSQHGFSLVELMIGMVIGLLATLVIVNVFTVFEQQKRATTGSSDAQTNGAIALYNIQRDVQLAGYGLPVYDTAFTPYKCGTENDAVVANATKFDHDNNPATPAIGLSPVVLVDGGAGGSDILAVRSGDTAKGGISVNIDGIDTNNTALVETNLGCQVGDTALMVAEDNIGCAMARVTTAAAGGNSIVFSPDLDGTDGIAPGAKLACIGPWNEYRYTVNNNKELTRSGAMVAGVPSAQAVAIVSDIVDMQAQYGISATAANNEVTQWVNATAGWANINNADLRNRIKAVRVAIVARSGLLEKTNVTATCSSLTDASPTGLCAWEGTATSPAPSIDLTADANWQRYRYRVYESIIPIRNIIWTGSAL